MMYHHHYRAYMTIISFEVAQIFDRLRRINPAFPPQGPHASCRGEQWRKGWSPERFFDGDQPADASSISIRCEKISLYDMYAYIIYIYILL